MPTRMYKTKYFPQASPIRRAGRILISHPRGAPDGLGRDGPWFQDFYHRLLLLLWLATAASLTYSPLVLGQGVPVLRDFDGTAAGTVVFNQFVGVTFVGGDSSNYDGSHPVTIVQPSQPTVSGLHALQGAFSRACEFCGTQMMMQFDIAQERVALSSGLAVAGGPRTILLQGFASDPTVNSIPPVASAVTACLGSGPTAINTPLEITDSTRSIRFAIVALADCGSPPNPGLGGDNGIILVDNLVYERPLNPPPGEHDSPVIEITYPVNGSTVEGSIPGLIDVTLHAHVTETALSSLTASLNGAPPRPMVFFHDAPASYQASIDLSDSNGLVDGVNSVVVHATDFDQPQNSATATSTFTFHVKPIPPPSQVDVIPIGVEVTQSIDSGVIMLTPNNFNIIPLIDGFRLATLSNIPMLTGKPTLIRVYGATTGTTAPVNSVPAIINVTRSTCTSGCELGAALAPTLKFAGGVATPNTAGVTLFPLGTPGSALKVLIPSLSSTWNFLLPADWATGDLDVDIYVNDGHYSNVAQQAAVQECMSGIAGQCSNNNHVAFHLHFQPAPQMIVHPVNFHVSGVLNGTTLNDIAPTEGQIQAVIAHLNEVYPANVARGADQTISVAPDASKDDLLDKISNFDSSNSSEMFIGLLPADQTGYQLAANEKQSDGSLISGYGSVGGRGAWADADNTTDPAHELAHNIGFDHWGCENGVTDDECGVFPIAHAGIGVIATDIVNWNVIPPGDNTSNSTPHAHDFMSYGQLCDLPAYGGGPGCDLGEWVSWYDYSILLTHLGVDSYDTDDPVAWLIRGHIDARGEVRFRPIFTVHVNHPIEQGFPEDDTEEMYTMLGRDTRGNILFVHNFEPHKMSYHVPEMKTHLLTIDTEVPVTPSMHTLELFFGLHKVGEIVRRTGPPIRVRVDSHGGAIWKGGRRPIIHWITNAANTSAQILYSPDGGKTLSVIARDVTGDRYTVLPEELVPSPKGRLFIELSDGTNVGATEVGPIRVLPNPPVVKIVTPRPGASISAGSMVTLSVQAREPSGPIENDRVIWYVDGVMKGSGSTLTLARLAEGTHTIGVRAKGRTNLVGAKTVKVHVIGATTH